MNLKPAIRFQEFKDGWEPKKYKDVFSFISTNSLSREFLNYQNGKVRNIHYGDIHTKFYTLFNIKKENVPFINENIDLTKTAFESFCKEGDLIIADASEDYEDVGKCIEVVNLNNERVLAGLHTIHARPNKFQVIIGFNGFLMQTAKVRLQIKTIAQGTKVLGISPTRLSEIDLFYPNFSEQTKITGFLKTIDKKLQTLKKKKSYLEEYKKGVIKGIFESKDSKNRIRFNDDNGNEFPEWKIMVLGQIADKKIIKNKNNIVKHVFTNSASSGIVNQRDYFDKDIANQDNLLNYYIVEKDDFIYNPRISNLAPVGPISRNHLHTGVMSPLYSVFKFHKGNLGFFEIYFSSNGWHEYMESIANYGARADRMSISSNDFYQMPVPFPQVEEQTKIFKFVSELDKKIINITSQISKTEQWKKGLLQKMFI